MVAAIDHVTSHKVGGTHTATLQGGKQIHKGYGKSPDSVGKAQGKPPSRSQSTYLRAQLPPPKKKKGHENYIDLLAQAFKDVYQSMAKGTGMQIKQFAEEQKLDQTNAQAVMIMTTAAVQKESAEESVENHLKSEMKHDGLITKVLGYVMDAIMGAVLVATIVSAIFDFGSSLAVVPEEVTAEGTLASGETTGEMTGESALQSALKTIGKKLLQMVGAGIVGSPMLVNGVMQQHIAADTKSLSRTEKSVGTALGKMTTNNAQLKFMQQQVQRSSGNLSQLAGQLGEVVSTFADITNTASKISTGLANAV